MATVDGNILIETKVDSSGVEIGLKQAEQAVKDAALAFTVAYRKQETSQTSASKRAWAETERNARVGTEKVKKDIKSIDNQVQQTSTKVGKVGTSIKSSLNSFGSSITKLGAAIGVAFGVGALIQFSKASIKASNEIENAMQGLKSIVEGQGRSFKKSKEFIDEYIKDGLIPATNAVTAYKNLAMRGYTDVQIEQTLIALKDSAAYGRQASLSMGEAVSSATEGLKNENSILVDNAGVTKNVSMMWKDYAKSIGVGVDSLTKQQRIQAEVLGIMEETRFQTGDAAKVADTYSGSILRLQFSLNNAKIAFGNFIKPIASVVIPVINSAIASFTRFFNTLAAISTALFGTQKNGAEQTKNQANSVGDTVKNETALGKAADKTNKKLKDQTSGLDEINTLSKEVAEGAEDMAPDIGGGIGGGVGGGIGGETTVVDFVADVDTSKVQGFVGKLTKIFKDFNKVLEPIKTSLQKLWKALTPLFLEGLAEIIDILNGVLIALTPLGEWLWNNFLQPIATWTGGLAVTILQLIVDGLRGLSDWINSHGETVRVAIESIAIAFGAWKALELLGYLQKLTGGEGLAGLGTTLADLTKIKMVEFRTAFEKGLGSIKDFIVGIKDTIVNAGKFVVEIAKSTAALVANSAQWVWSKVCMLASVVAQGAMTVATTAWNIICAIATGVTTAFGVAVAFLTSPIGLIIVAIIALITIVVLLVKNWDTVKEVAANVWESIVKTWGNFANWFNTKVWKPFMEGLKAVGNFFIGIWNNIIGAFESAVNWIIDGVNSILGAINNMLDFGGDLLKKVGINIELNIPTIPSVSFGKISALAKGAVIPPNKQFMAVLGDQRHGTNIEAPLDTILQAFRAENAGNENDTLLERIISLLEQLVNKPMIVELDGQEMGRSADTYQQNKGFNISKGAFANAR